MIKILRTLKFAAVMLSLGLANSFPCNSMVDPKDDPQPQLHVQQREEANIDGIDNSPTTLNYKSRIAGKEAEFECSPQQCKSGFKAYLIRASGSVLLGLGGFLLGDGFGRLACTACKTTAEICSVERINSYLGSGAALLTIGAVVTILDQWVTWGTSGVKCKR